MAQTTRTFRIFVSSTFSDLKEERNALQERCFPRLRELCTQHGCRFQAIDLRWGVRDEAGLDQQTMKICLDEVSRSQRASPKPNFVVLLGDRYGWRPLPAEIPAREFKHIETKTTNASDRQLFDTWYRRDDNARYKRNERAEPEAVYCLQPRSDRFAGFEAWENEVERLLRKILLRGIEGLDLTEDERRKYEASATEQEIAAGALKVTDARDHVFCFFRKIERLPEDESAKDFIDLDENGNLDSEAVAKLQRLKGEEREGALEVGLLETRLPGNIHRYNANWTDGGITTDHIGTLPESLEDCLSLLEAGSTGVSPARSGLCVDVWRRLARVILDEIARLESTELLEKEIADHVAFADDRARLFVGRSSMRDTIADYIAGSERRPLAVWGESGSGKSALVAKAIANCGLRNANCAVVSRFIGATPASSDGRALLESVCRQVTRIYGADEATISTDYRALVTEFGERLKLATAGQPLIVFLDALDQLSDANLARNLIWLPAELPENVRLVVSTLPGECKTALERRLPSANLVKLEPMPTEEADELLGAWLTKAGRTLQPRQRTEVLTKFALSAMTTDESGGDEMKEHGMPLYLKLAFEEARRWKSYTPVVDLAPDIPGIIRKLFDRLSSDANHGTTIVSRSLGYLAAAKNGLSEDEMLDVLSLDEDVRADFKARAKHTPPEEHLPVVVWSRLYFDLEPYLTERSADAASLLSFYHRQLREVVEAEFLSGDKKPARHAHIADYFAHQDLFEPQKKTPNVRKLSELPYQQTYGGKWDELHATLTDFEFLEAKLTHVAVITSGKGENAKTIYGGVYELQEDYRRAVEKWPT
jgi:NACHT domain- and WD repeat-containing protein